MKTKVLLVEDEPFLGKIVKESLETRAYEVRLETTGTSGLKALEHFFPDIILLDVMLPGMDGFELAEAIRNNDPMTPIIFLTAKTQTEDVLKGFQTGANDYMRKPFSVEELIARMENALKPGQSQAERVTDKIQLGDYVLHTKSQLLQRGEEERKISHREMELLRMLYTYRDGMLDRRHLLLTIWHDDSYFNSRNLDVYISRLRGYLKADPRVEIITLKGQGYRLVVPGG